jgi:beta-lactam-binding protein with PASTA domain
MKWFPPLVIACGLIAAPAHADSFIGWVGVPLMQQGGAADVAVPNVVGQASSAAADTILMAAGLDLGGVTARCSSDTVNHVVGQSPAPGVLVVAGSLVDVLISNGVACDLAGKAGVRLRGLRMPGI